MKAKDNKILIVGLGNPLRGDDGLGIKVVDKLKEEKALEASVLKVGTSPINYLQEISSFETIIAIDAIQGGQQAGSIYELSLADIKQPSKQNKTAHSYSLSQVTALARETSDLPRKVIIYGLEPADLKFNDQVSEQIKKKLPQLINKLKTKIKSIR